MPATAVGVRSCAVCDEPLPPKRQSGGAPRRYCSRRCLTWASRNPGRQRSRRRTCQRCGTALPRDARTSRKWCGARCRKEHHLDPARGQLETLDQPTPESHVDSELVPWLMGTSEHGGDDPQPIPAPPDWYADAACNGHDPALWFPEGQGASPAEAIAVCRRCPVRSECADYATAEGFAFGVWGGVNLGRRGSAHSAANDAP